MSDDNLTHSVLLQALRDLDTNPGINVWVDIKSELTKDAFDDKVIGVLVSVLKKLVCVETLKRVWLHLFAVFGTREFDGELSELGGLLNAHRFLANHLPSVIDISDFRGEKHIEKFANSLLHVCFQQTSVPHSLVSRILLEFGDVFQSAFVVAVVSEGFDPNSLFESCSSQAALHLSILLIRRCLLNPLLLKCNNISVVMTSLTANAVKLYSIAEVLHALFFKIKWNSLSDVSATTMTSYAHCIVSAFPQQTLEVAYHTAALWSEKTFVDGKSVALKALLSHCLMCSLSKLDTDSVLATVEDSGVSLCSLLSVGISHYLDTADKQTRILGMRVATALSESLGNRIHFDELAKCDAVPSSSSGVACESGVYSSTSAVNASGGGDDDDTDGSDSDLEPFDFDMSSAVVTSGPAELQTNYLTVCLNMLRVAEDKPDAAKKHLAALDRICDLMTSDVLPYDSKDLCVPLVNQLLIMVDHFNQQGFEEKRHAAILTLLVAHPSLTVPAVTKCILSTDCTLGLRLACIGYLCDAAKAISKWQHSSDGSSSRSTGTSGSSSSSGSGSSGDMFRAINALTQTSTTTTAGPESPWTNNTKVTHPRRLQAKARPTLYYRNTFAAVSHLFFVPLCSLLAPVSGDTSKTIHAVGLDAILPSKVLCALSVIVQCSVNTIYDRRYALETLRLSFLYRTTSDLELKRASLTAALNAVIILTRKPIAKRQVNGSGGGVLSTLTSIAQSQLASDVGEDDLVQLQPEELELLVAEVDWVASSVSSDTDDQSRLIKQLIVQSVHDALQK